MLGFLIKGKVNDDAVLLHSETMHAFDRYCTSDIIDAALHIGTDFPDANLGQKSRITWWNKKVPCFLFTVAQGLDDEHLAITIIGKNEYNGFMLMVSGPDKPWMVRASDMIASAATGAAVKLANTMVKKYGAIKF